MTQKTLGCLEKVSIPALSVHSVWAKIDTGAFTGALHCTHIRRVRNRVTGERYLTFTPLGNPELKQHTTDYEVTYVRSASGHRNVRYIIPVTIQIDGKKLKTKIGLSDRSDLSKPVLIGRRFLREHGLLVDVRRNQEFDTEGERTRE